jgi:hypothetical protein
VEIKCLEVRDAGTFCPVICIHPVASNEEQRYLLRRDGYRADPLEHCIIYIQNQCRGVAYDPYHFPQNPRTHRVAHIYITENWSMLKDGDVIDVEFILGETSKCKVSERHAVANWLDPEHTQPPSETI